MSLSPAPSIDYSSEAYRQAYALINGVVIMGENHADHHFRLLADAIPADREELLALAAMEARHAREFVVVAAISRCRPTFPWLANFSSPCTTALPPP